tara:strand:- start:795 stop:1079 length:285 start_codon:yes stop_codon:yes gene_type:complete
MDRKKNTNSKKDNLKIEKKIDQYRKEIENMTYEDSMKKLDKILDDLQTENVAIEKIQDYYTKGNLLVQHCRKLLTNLEQEIIEINSEKFLNPDS